MDNFAEGVGAVYGMFDGDRNEELPRLLQCTMADVLLEEVQQSTNDIKTLIPVELNILGINRLQKRSKLHDISDGQLHAKMKNKMKC